jgi:hypothetical protein
VLAVWVGGVARGQQPRGWAHGLVRWMMLTGVWQGLLIGFVGAGQVS